MNELEQRVFGSISIYLKLNTAIGIYQRNILRNGRARRNTQQQGSGSEVRGATYVDSTKAYKHILTAKIQGLIHR